MTKRKSSGPVRTLSRWQASLNKRLFWRRHLTEASETIQALRSELPTPEMQMTLAYLFQGKGYYQTLGLKQNMTELLALVNVLGRQPLRHVCELGTFKGGTLFVWCQLAAPDAQIISIDLPGGQFGGGYHERSLPFFQAFCRPGQTLQCLRGSSHDAGIRAAFTQTLDGRQLDFLFIDGDHSYAGVKQDFVFYSQHVRAGGLIAFHDIVQREGQPEIEVHRLWNEVKARYRHEEFIEPSAERRKIGIGLIYKD